MLVSRRMDNTHAAAKYAVTVSLLGGFRTGSSQHELTYFPTPETHTSHHHFLLSTNSNEMSESFCFLVLIVPQCPSQSPRRESLIKQHLAVGASQKVYIPAIMLIPHA